jgi:hypothetical protein
VKFFAATSRPCKPHGALSVAQQASHAGAQHNCKETRKIVKENYVF